MDSCVLIYFLFGFDYARIFQSDGNKCFVLHMAQIKIVDWAYIILQVAGPPVGGGRGSMHPAAAAAVHPQSWVRPTRGHSSASSTDSVVCVIRGGGWVEGYNIWCDKIGKKISTNSNPHTFRILDKFAMSLPYPWKGFISDEEFPLFSLLKLFHLAIT